MALFGTATAYPAGPDARAVAIADVNGDGIPDLVVADGGATYGNGIVDVLLGTGGGGFAVPVSYAAGASPIGVVVADVNGDGLPDVVVADPGGDVEVLLGTGGGALSTAATIAAGIRPLSVAVADVNGDGHPDLVVADGYGGVNVLLSNGNGGFSAATTYAVGDTEPNSVAVADLNGDGRLDLVVSTQYGGVSVLLASAGGGFSAATTYKLSGLPGGAVATAVADVNGDGHPDLVALDEQGDVDVLLNTGSGSFSAPTSYRLIGGSDIGQSVAVADVNGDGIPDVVVAVGEFTSRSTSFPGGVDVLLGTGSGSFSAATYYAAGINPTSVAVADVNSDGHPDIVVADPGTTNQLDNSAGSVEVLLNTGSDEVPCFVRGTRILATRGAIAVEDLRVGEPVLTLLDRGEDGRGVPKPVHWIGHRRIALAGHPGRQGLSPVRIRTGALAEGVPCRDLLVSPGHRLPLDGALHCALDLVNGATIVQEAPDAVEYWHVEVEGHDILLAEGAEAESYQDTGNRDCLSSANVVALRPRDGGVPVLDQQGPAPCLPYGVPGRALRERLAVQAEALGWRRERDSQPWVEAGGLRVEGMRRRDRYRFVLPAGCAVVRLRSRSVRPCDATPELVDARQLGLHLHRLALCGPDGVSEVPLDHPLLGDGFHDAEREADGWLLRWTDGDALLPVAGLAADRVVAVLEVGVDEDAVFWTAPPSPEGRARQSDARA